MITGDLERRIDRVVDALGSGGLANPLEIVEQVCHLLFLRRLDDLQTLAEGRVRGTGRLLGDVIFLPGERHLRWRAVAGLDPDTRYDLVAREVFPWLRRFGGEGSTYADHLGGALFTIPTPALLGEVVDLVDAFPLDDRESSGDGFSRLVTAAGASSGLPSRVQRLMVELSAPRPDDDLCDPRCGAGELLVAAAAYVRDHHPTALTESAQERHPGSSMFHGADASLRMLRIASMNLLMHGIDAPDVRAAVPDGATLVLTDLRSSPDDLASVLALLAPGGRAVVVVADEVLSDEKHHDVRRSLVDDHRLDAVVRLPSGPLLLLARVDPRDDHEVWCFDADDDDLPEVAARWPMRAGSERSRDRIDRSFTVPRAEIVEHGYDLGLHRYE